MELGISDDYAVLYGNGMRFYFGYEEQNEDEEWLFTADINNKRIIECTAEDLGIPDWDSCEEVLIMGIGKYIKQNGELNQ